LNFLTKMFVILLVVSSLLLSAAVVVFVNKVEDFKTTGAAQAKALKGAQSERDAARADADSTRAQAVAAAKDFSAREADLTKQINGAEAKAQELSASVAQATKDAQVKDMTNKGISDALRAAQEENKGLSTLVAEIRNKNDELLKQNGELNTQLTVLDNKLRATDRALAYEQEHSAELQGELKNLQGGGAKPAGGASMSSTPINAVVRSVDIIGGKKYATISVGSADNVAKGMKFNIVNRNTAEYLGTLTVDRVDVNEAIGQVEGSKIDKVQPGVEAKTQL
jgi:hypothetical protein